MQSIKFPDMFNSNNTRVWRADEYMQATRQNAFLLLQSERGELECDPYFGILLKHYTFNQNNYILKDILIDALYTQLALFLPQLRINRKDIDIIQDRERGIVYCRFSGINQIDFQMNTYQLQLFNESQV